MSRKIAAAIAFSLHLLLAACGGGGGTNSTMARPVVVSALDFPIDATLTAFISRTKANADSNKTPSWEMGTPYGYRYEARINPRYDHICSAITYVGSEADENVIGIPLETVHVARILTDIPCDETRNYYLFSFDSFLYYTTEPFTLWGAHDWGVIQVNNEFAGEATIVFSERTPAPTTAKVGQSGSLASGTYTYIEDGVLYTAQQSRIWSLEADTAETAWLCYTVNKNDHALNGYISNCIRIDSNGSISGFKAILSNMNETIIFDQPQIGS